MRKIGDLARMLAVSEHAAGRSGATIAEAAASVPDGAVPERPDAVVERADAALSRHAGVSEADWNRARELFLRCAGSTLSRVVQRQSPAPHDRMVMEAIVIADGSRPSFLLTGGEVDPRDPFIGRWGGAVATAQAAGSASLAKAVGRIQPVGGHASRFAGTGTLVSADPALVLTNFHVIQYARNRFGISLTPAGDRFTVKGDLEIDFLGEADSLDECRFRIVEVQFPAGKGETFAGIDAAVCRIEPHHGDAATILPKPAAVLSARNSYINGAITSLALIGFPAPPEFDNREVDWDWVVRTLFGNRFGVKRLAPGQFAEKLGTNSADTHKLAIGHDATTFGGASGSLVAAWLDSGTPAFALHFGGLTRSGNYALSFQAAQTELRAIGVPV